MAKGLTWIYLFTWKPIKGTIAKFAQKTFNFLGYNIGSLEDLTTERERDIIRERIMAKVRFKVEGLRVSQMPPQPCPPTTTPTSETRQPRWS
jgi:hypothetical protein